MAHVDLDAARQARYEALGESPTVTLGGRVYKLTPEMSIDTVTAWRANDARGFVGGILADSTETDDFLANSLSWLDLNEVFRAFLVDAGESPAS
jgi:hypothetical protein